MAVFPTYKELGEKVLENIEITIKDTTNMTLRECVEKQIPKEVIQGDGVPVCPNCKALILLRKFESKGDHCKWCGQRLEWEV